MDISLKILRYDPELIERLENYVVDAEPEERILDLLHKIKWFEDVLLSFEDLVLTEYVVLAMVINGENSAQVLVKEVEIL